MMLKKLPGVRFKAGNPNCPMATLLQRRLVTFHLLEINLQIHNIQMIYDDDHDDDGDGYDDDVVFGLLFWFHLAETNMSALRPWQKCPVAKVFQKNDEFEDWGTKAKKGRSIWWNLRPKTRLLKAPKW